MSADSEGGALPNDKSIHQAASSLDVLGQYLLFEWEKFRGNVRQFGRYLKTNVVRTTGSTAGKIWRNLLALFNWSLKENAPLKIDDDTCRLLREFDELDNADEDHIDSLSLLDIREVVLSDERKSGVHRKLPLSNPPWLEFPSKLNVVPSPAENDDPFSFFNRPMHANESGTLSPISTGFARSEVSQQQAMLDRIDKLRKDMLMIMEWKVQNERGAPSSRPGSILSHNDTVNESFERSSSQVSVARRRHDLLRRSTVGGSIEGLCRAPSETSLLSFLSVEGTASVDHWRERAATAGREEVEHVHSGTVTSRGASEDEVTLLENTSRAVEDATLRPSSIGGGENEDDMELTLSPLPPPPSTAFSSLPSQTTALNAHGGSGASVSLPPGLPSSLLLGAPAVSAPPLPPPLVLPSSSSHHSRNDALPLASKPANFLEQVRQGVKLRSVKSRSTPSSPNENVNPAAQGGLPVRPSPQDLLLRKQNLNPIPKSPAGTPERRKSRRFSFGDDKPALNDESYIAHALKMKFAAFNAETSDDEENTSLDQNWDE